MTEEIHQRNWALIDKFGFSSKVILDELKAAGYTTLTQGKRHLPAVIPCVEGAYTIIIRENSNTYRLYI